MELFRIGFIVVSLNDIFDIVLVAVLFYRLYLYFKGSRASQMLIGLIIILIVSFFAHAFNLSGLSWIFSQLQTVWVIAFVIIFQPELRRLLIYIGQSRLFRLLFRVKNPQAIDEVVEACKAIIEREWGALIVFQRESGLKTIKETGTKINGEVSVGLILSIFNPGSPLHDGAVIIHNNIVEAAGCILPLTESTEIDPTMGTRHRAALGLSEESDAAIIVVSEETGRIALAHNGVLYRNLDEDSLRGMLNRLLLTTISS